MITKSHHDDIKEKDCFMDAIISTTQLVQEQVKQGSVVAVINNQGERVNLEEVATNDWIINLRTIRKQTNRKTEVFIKIVTITYLGELIKPNINILNKERLSL